MEFLMQMLFFIQFYIFKQLITKWKCWGVWWNELCVDMQKCNVQF